MDYNITLVGPSYVGKTAIVMNLLRNIFLEDYQPTLEDTYCIQLVVDGESCILHITDTSGMEEYSLMLENQIRNADGILSVFSVDSMESFDSMNSYLNKVQLVSNVPIMLIGNKCDKLEKEKEVNNHLGEVCAEQYGIPFFTTSAKTGERILYCFHTLVRSIRHSRFQGRSLEVKNKHCCIIC